MPSKTTPPPNRNKRRSQRKTPRRKASPHTPKLDKESVETITERLDMMLPEVMSRIAAVEHLLVEKNICSPNDLRRSRQFIDKQESW